METRHAITRRLITERAVAVLRLDAPDRLLPVIDHLHAGGISVIEITMTVPDALDAIRTAAGHVPDHVVLGAGSVTSAPMAEAAIAAGARFVVSPIFAPEIIDAAHAHDAPALPGTLTPTEMQRAHAAGADMVKLFPAKAVGPSYLAAVRAPLPHLPVMATGGVTPDHAGDWLRAGAAAVGVGSALLDRTAIAAGRYDVLTEAARRLRRAVDAVPHS